MPRILHTVTVSGTVLRRVAAGDFPSIPYYDTAMDQADDRK